MSFENLAAPNPTFNATLDQAHEFVQRITDAGHPGPTVYGGDTSANWALIPEKADQTPLAPGVDNSKDLAGLGVPNDVPIFLQIYVPDKQNFYCVGTMIREFIVYGAHIEQVLS